MDLKHKKISKYLTNSKLSIETTYGFLESILQNSRDAIYRYDLRTERCDFISNSVEPLTGYTPQEIYDQGISLLTQNLHPDDEPKFTKLYSGLLNSTVSEMTIQLEYRFRHKNGAYLWHNHVISIIRDKTGKIQATVGAVRDITSQKKHELELKSSQERFKRLSEATFEGVCIHNQGRMIDANQHFLEMLGVNSVDEIKGVDCFRFIEPQYHDLVKRHISTGDQGPYEILGRKADGTVFPVRVCARECQWEGKSARIATFRDLTEQKQLEQQLKISLNRFKHLFENAPDAIFLADIETGVIAEANCKAAELLGIPVSQIVGMHQAKLHPPEEAKAYQNIFREHIQKNPAVIADNLYVQHKNGRKIPVQINASIMRFDDREFACGIFRDITELQQSNEKLRLFSEATFEGIVLHDREHFIEANQQFLDMFGYTLTELRQTVNGDDLIAPECLKKTKELIESQCEAPYEVTCQRKDGSSFHAEFHGREITIDGVPCRIVAVRNLTAKKHLIRDLAASEAKYKELYVNAKAALYRTRIKDGKLLACSLVTAKIHGYDTVEECIENHHGIDHFVDKDRRAQLLDKLLKNKRVEDFQYQIRRPDNKTAWLSLTAEIFPEKGWIEGVITDITASKILTKTEMRILKIILSGKSNKEIAYALGRSIRTIEDHRGHIMCKLGVDNIVEMTRRALEYGIKPDGE